MDSKTKNRKRRSELEAMAAKAFGELGLAASDDAVLELKDGWFNASYMLRLADGREVVVKIAPPAGADVLEYEKNIMATEVSTMRLVRRNPAIPVPEIYFFDDSLELCDAPYFFMERCAGETLEHARGRLSAERLASLEQRTGEIICDVNRFSGTFFGYESNPELRANGWKDAFVKIVDAVLRDGRRKNVVYDHSPDELRAAVMKHADALDDVTTPCLVHWDAWDPNWFVRDGQIAAIIDFERALWGDPLMEAQFRGPAFGKAVTDSMRGYGKTSFTFREDQRCHLYTLHLALVMNTECYFRNYDTDDVFHLSRRLMGSAMDWLTRR